MKRTLPAGLSRFRIVPWTASFREQLSECYAGLMAGLAGTACARLDELRDAVHDVLVRGLAPLDLEHIRNLGGYLRRAALHAYWRRARERARMKSLNSLARGRGGALVQEGPDAGHLAAVREQGRLAWDELERLPLRQREVLGRWCLGSDLDEIARDLGISPGNVRFHKHAAIRSLRKRLGDPIDEEAGFPTCPRVTRQRCTLSPGRRSLPIFGVSQGKVMGGIE
jgi:DNA-directed RNA polymerase specialized sigma24 family protein